MPPTISKKCLIPACQKPVAVNCRGLCMKCYSSAKRKVESGASTWDKLAEMGLVEAQEDDFTRAFDKAIKEND